MEDPPRRAPRSTVRLWPSVTCPTRRTATRMGLSGTPPRKKSWQWSPWGTRVTTCTYLRMYVAFYAHRTGHVRVQNYCKSDSTTWNDIVSTAAGHVCVHIGRLRSSSDSVTSFLAFMAVSIYLFLTIWWFFEKKMLKKESANLEQVIWSQTRMSHVSSRRHRVVAAWCDCALVQFYGVDEIVHPVHTVLGVKQWVLCSAELMLSHPPNSSTVDTFFCSS